MKFLIPLLLVAITIIGCQPSDKPTKSPKPNVLFILADDLGYGDLQSYNPESKIPTPNLDQLAKDGIRFTDVHTPSSVCTPTRYSLLTGRYAWRTRLKHKVLWPFAQPLIDSDRKTLPDLFKDQGYQTAMFGKWHLGWKWALEDSTSYLMERKMDGNWGGGGIDLTKQIKEGPNGAGFDYAFGV
ncbi:MAG: sulfatase-like hydrolase/transferase, partial [Ekhidna sp.]|nr:sulfatase-like hydrolase/transferase [Ekhidna sp.]